MINIDIKLLDELSQNAANSVRKRAIYSFHRSDSDTLQRMLNAIEPGTYVRPHKHENPDKREVFIVLRGRAAFFVFDNNGNITKITIADSSNGVCGVEIPARTWHTLVSLERKTVLYEVKDGPYDIKNDKTFAKWAPDENTSQAKTYLCELINKAVNK